MSVIPRLGSLVTAVLILAALEDTAIAACFPPGPIRSELSSHKAVFLGEAIEVKFDRGLQTWVCKLRVRQAFKGVKAGSKQKVYSWRAGAESFNPRRGRVYLVFARTPPEGRNHKELWVAGCSPTREEASARSDLDSLAAMQSRGELGPQ
jgi:hypothetical protein